MKYLGFSTREDADDHGRLRAHLKQKRRKGDANRLDDLRKLRNDADYSNNLSFQEDLMEEVNLAIEKAKMILESLSPPIG